MIRTGRWIRDGVGRWLGVLLRHKQEGSTHEEDSLIELARAAHVSLSARWMICTVIASGLAAGVCVDRGSCLLSVWAARGICVILSCLCVLWAGRQGLPGLFVVCGYVSEALMNG